MYAFLLSFQRTPLHIAASEGYLNPVITLLEKTDMNITDKDGVSNTILEVDQYC